VRTAGYLKETVTSDFPVLRISEAGILLKQSREDAVVACPCAGAAFGLTAAHGAPLPCTELIEIGAPEGEAVRARVRKVRGAVPLRPLAHIPLLLDQLC